MIKYEDGKIIGGLDSNKDGELSLGLELSIGEALEEAMGAMKKGEKVEVTVEAKAVKYSFEDGKIKITVDTDKDGEVLLSAYVDMAEAFEEIAAAVLKKQLK